jgi:hypothetical protein
MRGIGPLPDIVVPAAEFEPRATVCRCISGVALVRSKCIWFCRTFSASDGRNRMRNPVSSSGISATPSASSAGSQPKTPAQKRASRSGSCASTQRATS